MRDLITLGRGCFHSWAAIFMTLLHAAAVPLSASEDRPNLVWLMAEDIGPDLECYGMPGVRTPNLNRLAAEGARFTRAYCSNPICSPNRSAMMVGADQTRMNAHHHRSNRDEPLPAPFKPVTHWLRQAGYTCVLGHSQVMGQGRKTDCNFKHQAVGAYDGVMQFGLFDTTDDFNAGQQPFFNQIQLQVTHRGDWWNPVRRDSEHPVPLEAVELPPWIADTLETRYDWAAYLDTIEYMDGEVGLLMERLREQNLHTNTVVIFIGDNGRCNLRGKGYLHESGIHVPLIVWAPGRVAPGTVVGDLVSTTDIPATLLNLAGAELPAWLDGRPFLGPDCPAPREYVRSARDIWDEIDECSRSITTERYAYIRNYMPEVPWDAHQAYLDLNRPALHVMRRLKAEGNLQGDTALFFADRKPFEELYDLESDPHQLRNLAENPDHVAVLKRMRGYESEWLSQYRDCGLEDLGRRVPERGLAAEVACEYVKQHRPDLWKRLESGELMETHAWFKFGQEKETP